MSTEAPPLIRGPLRDARARFPWNGYRTGSAHVPADAPVRDHPLRPRFAWDDDLSATRYELQVDDSCERSAYRECAFDSPEAVLVTTESDVNLEEPLPVSMEVPVGRRYYWRVRACDEEHCTAWTEPRYLDVGRAREDYDGDGYPDVAVFAPSVAAGYVGDGTFRPIQVWRGGADGPGPARVFGLELDEGERPDFVGSVGDVNGDGYDDLFVLTSRAHSTGGRIFETPMLWLGSPAGPFATTPEPWPTLEIEWWTDPPPTLRWARGIGDLDADGFDDVLAPIGSYVAYGSATGPSEWLSPVDVMWRDMPNLESVDWNGDGYLDLVGVNDSGELGWRPGAPGLRDAASVLTSTPISRSLLHYNELWRIDDMDRDGFPELLAFNGGRDLYVLWGARRFPMEYDLEAFDWLTGLHPGYPRFYTGDVDGDGYAELAALRMYDPDWAVSVLRGNAERRPHLMADCRMRDPYARFIAPSPLHDYDADGYADQIWFAKVSDEAPMRPDEWRVVLFRGGPRGLPWAPTREVHAFPPAEHLRLEIGGLGFRPG